MMMLPVYTPHIPLITQRLSPPVVTKVMPQPSAPIKIIETTHGLVTSAETAYRLRYIDRNFAVTLMNGRAGQIVSLKPAQGELMRHPTKFVVVTWNEVTKQRDEVVVKSWQPLHIQ